MLPKVSINPVAILMAGIKTAKVRKAWLGRERGDKPAFLRGLPEAGTQPVPIRCLPVQSDSVGGTAGQKEGEGRSLASEISALSSHARKNQAPASWIQDQACKPAGEKGGSRVFVLVAQIFLW